MAAAALAGCAQPGGYGNSAYNAPPPPGYNQPGYNQPGYNQPGYGQQPGYQQQGPATYQAPAGSVFTGRVESIEPITTEQNSSGILGTVIGGAAGGLLGNQIGGGRGRTAATIGGAVVGAVAGNQVEKRTGSNTSTVYRVNVRLDDGRMASVTQRDVGALRIGDRARVANDMAMPY
ncbi:glycine zipper 2TM domain-containing protein [Cupriavidus pauculus]|nr:glycine zipper 2TM domain-containing protein [Cupriavidus pauculus]